MGCLEFLLELIFDSVLEGYFALMQWIIPKKWLGKHFQTALKIIIGIFTCLLFIIMLLGFFALISDDVYTRIWGRYMVCVPLVISVVQILLGVVLRIITGKK